MKTIERMREEVPKLWMCVPGAMTCELPSESLDPEYCYFKPTSKPMAVCDPQPAIEIDGEIYYRWWVYHRGGLRLVFWATTSVSAMRVARRRADEAESWTVPQRAIPAGRYF